MKNKKTTPWFSMALVGVSLIFTGTARAQRLYLVVDRDSGSVQAVSSADVNVDGYSISSPAGRLNPDAWNSLTDQSLPGWFESNPRAEMLTELNWEGSSPLGARQPVSLGSVYSGGLILPSEEDVGFQYTTPDGLVHDAGVLYTGGNPIDDLVLQVDVLSGAASIQNPSAVAGPFDLVGYSITSASGSLSVDNWTSFADSGAAGEGWFESNPRADAIAELNPTGSILFDQNKSVSIGNILAGNEDFVFEYGLRDGTATLGTVQYVLNLGGTTPGDCNGDGVLDAADLACVSTIEDRDAVLAALNTLPGDLDGNGDVAFPDFLTLSANFGQDLPSYTAGNIDLTGGVAFPDFLALSANFGRTPGGAAAAVPEPATGLLAALGMLFLLAIRKRR